MNTQSCRLATLGRCEEMLAALIEECTENPIHLFAEEDFAAVGFGLPMASGCRHLRGRGIHKVEGLDHRLFKVGSPASDHHGRRSKLLLNRCTLCLVPVYVPVRPASGL